MIEYIKEFIDVIVSYEDKNVTLARKRYGATSPDFARLTESLAEELNRLDPRDFEPSARCDFVALRTTIRACAKNIPDDRSHTIGPAQKIKILLDAYTGEGTGAKTRNFSFVSNPDVREIVERDYRELALRTFPDGSWKSTVILAGSILEAVLYDLLTKDQATSAAAMASPRAPKKKKGSTVKNIMSQARDDEWFLDDLIKVACDLGRMPYNNEQTVHLALREYRNLVHPRLEAKMRVTISEAHATTSKGMLDVILDHLTPP